MAAYNSDLSALSPGWLSAPDEQSPPGGEVQTAGGTYEEGWPTDRVALPDSPSDQGFAKIAPDMSNDASITKALQDYANAAPAWSPDQSGLNLLLDRQDMHDIFGGGDNPENSAAAAPPDNGFYTGLQPFVPDPQGQVGSGINGNGYFPKPGDANLLARLIMAEGANTPQDGPALGWAIVNRVGNREFGKTLDQVAHQKNAFESVQDNNDLWSASANPDGFTGPNAKAWQQSQATAQGILGGLISDPTGGASLFFSSDSYNPKDPKSVPPGSYPTMLQHGSIFSSPSYPSTPDRNSGTRNYFFVENPYRK